jgi:hypothetical protein
MPENVIFKTLAAPGQLTPATVPTTQIYGFITDLAGTLTITDGLGIKRIDIKLGAPTTLFLPGAGVTCQNGANVAFTGPTSVSVIYGA